MGNKSRRQLIGASIMALFIVIGMMFLFDNINKSPEDLEEVEVIEIDPDKQKLDELKNYLKENYERFVIDGSTSTKPLHEALNNVFNTTYKDVLHNKTVDAFNKFINGENDILLGVDYSDELLEKAKNSGIDLGKLEITREGFVFLINKNNPVKSLTIEQIKDIYSGKITNWNQVGGDDAPINAFQRNRDSGSQIRMVKFMGDTQLMEKDVTYYSNMSSIVEVIGNYDQGKYSIGYNMYTFTEKQYPNQDVILLDVNGVHPNDETIFDESYPLVIYNYIYYDKNDESTEEFVEKLYEYLMHEEGQSLISNAGYINLNIKYDRNLNVNQPLDPDDSEFGAHMNFYNESKGEFYRADNDGNLIVYNSLVDYVLRDTDFYTNENAINFINRVFNSDIPLDPETAILNKDNASIQIGHWFDGSLDEDDFFNIRYKDQYYNKFEYLIYENKYVLSSISKEQLDSYKSNGYLDMFPDYADNIMFDTTIEIYEEDLKDIYFRLNNYWTTKSLNYIQPFTN